MSRESEFASARMRHSVWNECYDEVISIPASKKSTQLLIKTAALIRADRHERRMNDFINGCLEEARGSRDA